MTSLFEQTFEPKKQVQPFKNGPNPNLVHVLSPDNEMFFNVFVFVWLLVSTSGYFIRFPNSPDSSILRLKSSLRDTSFDVKNEKVEGSILDYIKRYQKLKTNSNLAAGMSLWNSTLIELKRASKEELKFLTRTSFSTDDYFENILRKDLKSENNPFESGLILSLGASGFFSSFLLPFIPGPVAVRNTVGLIFLALPFLYMGASTVFPTLLLKIASSLRPSAEKQALRDRLCYHEAGHFLVGYLCGLPILEYNINDEQGASLAIATPSVTVSTAPATASELSSPDHISVIERSIGSLLAISMAGVVAESLVFNNCKGGREDFPFALQMVSSYEFAKYKVRQNAKKLTSQSQSQSRALEAKEGFELREEVVDEYLRGGVMKALVLLRLHRESLDRIAVAMQAGKSVYEIVDVLETRRVDS